MRGPFARRMLGPIMSCWVAVVSSSCAPVVSETGILLQIEVEPEVRRLAAALEVEIEGRGEMAGWGVPRALRTEVPGGDGEPLRIAVEPESSSASRQVRVTVRVLDPSKRPILMVRAESGFLQKRWILLRLLLQDACLGVACELEQSCRGGRCEPSWRDPETLPDVREAQAGAET